MRILLTTDTIGGVWTFTQELTEGLLAFGHEVALVSLGRLPTPMQTRWCDATWRESREAFRFEALDSPLEWMEENEASYSSAEHAIRRIAQEFKPDVLHCNQFCLGALQLDVTKVVTAHSDVLSWAEVCRPGGLDDTAWLRRYCALVEAGLSGADAVVAPTKWMAQALLRGFSGAGDVQVIANGRTLKAPASAVERKLQAISVGRRWDEAKNMAVLDGMEQVLPVVIAGETLLGEADALCEDELMALFRQSSIYVATSLYEPFGLAPLEAALCGCAVIAKDVPSLREVWGSGAMYFEDNASLTATLTMLTQSAGTLEKARKQSISRASKYPAVKMVDEYIALYAELLDGRNEAALVSAELMPAAFRIAYLAHAVRSDWNNGNAHFLRGLLHALGQLGHDVTVFEPRDAWSITNLRQESLGADSLAHFARTYPALRIEEYAEDAAHTWWQQRLQGFEVVVLHEWNPPALAQRLLRLRDELGFVLVFHDTHHRASSSPDQMELFGLAKFDGVLAFGEALRTIYRERYGLVKVWTLHEAADTEVFKPVSENDKTADLVWVGNWGDGERSREIKEFLLEPAAALAPAVRTTIYGVRYPDEGVRALDEAGVHYGGYLPNLDAPEVYGRARLTVHVPRQHYAGAMHGIPTIRVFEALACGIPLVSAPWRDTEDLFRAEDFRMVQDGAGMLDAMRSVLEDPARAQEQASRGLETILARHTCRHRAEQLTGILEELRK